MRQQRRRDHEGGIGLALRHRHRGRRRAVERDVRGLDAALGEEQLHRQVRRAAVAERRVVDLAALRLGPGDELGHRLRRHLVGIDREHVRLRGRHHHRHQILRRVVRHLAVEKWRERDRPVEADAQRVRVGRLGDHIHAEHAAGAGLVLDDHRLAPARAELVAHRAHDQVERAAGPRRHDDLHRLGRPGVLRQRGRRSASAAAVINERRSMEPPL